MVTAGFPVDRRSLFGVGVGVTDDAYETPVAVSLLKAWFRSGAFLPRHYR